MLLCYAPAVEGRGGEEGRGGGEGRRGEERRGGEERGGEEGRGEEERRGEERGGGKGRASRGEGSRWESMEDERVAEGERRLGKVAKEMGEDDGDSLEYRVQEREQSIWQKGID